MSQTKTNDLIKFALKLLSVRDYFSCELIKRLKKKDDSTENIEKAMNYLNKFNYIDDEAVLEKYVQEIFKKQKGINYLKKKLYDKGCAELVSGSDLSVVYSKEMEKIAARKMAGSMKSYTVEKIVGRMKSRGFSSDVIYEIFEELKK